MAILSQTVSDDLKTALLAQEYDVAIQPGDQFYKNGNLYLSHDTYAGKLLGSSHQVHAEKFETNDSEFIRAWLSVELYGWLVAHVQYENHEFATINSGLSRQYTLTVGGLEFVTEQLIDTLSQQEADLEAFGKAVVALLEYEDFNDLRN